MQPDEVYNLAAQSFVPTSWQQPVLTGEFTAIGVTRVLEAIRAVKSDDRVFTRPRAPRCSAKSRLSRKVKTRRSIRAQPYGVAKVYGHWITVNYRESYDMFAVSGILFNHESPRRGKEFVTRKISDGVARIKLGLAKRIASRKSRSEARLGIRGRLRARDVADAAARAPRRLRHCDGTHAYGARVRPHCV